MPEPYLRTERLVLRRITPADVDNLVILNSDDAVMRYLDWKPPTRAQVAAEVAALLEAYQAHPQHGRYIAEDRDGTFLGWFELTVNSDGPSFPELGYRLRTSTWGKGLATEGARALIRHAFSRLNAERVTAETMFVNAASRRVMEKCGMRHVRTFHVHFDNPLPGTEHGEVLYEITRDEWLADQQHT